MDCKICNDSFKNKKSLRGHICHFHKIDAKTYALKYETDLMPKCKCGEICSLRGNRNNLFNKTCGSKECSHNFYIQKRHSEITKEKLRKKRFEYLKLKTGKTAWERRNKGEMSYLEQWFYDNIILKYNLQNKYDIINEYPFYPYFVDFAFMNIELAVELDGGVHFINGKRIEHDNKKNEFLVNKNWNVYRISGKPNEETEIDFMKYLGNFKNETEKHLECKVYKGKITEQKIHRTSEEYWKSKRDNYDKKQKVYVNKILNSNIDFSKFGWVKQVSELINQKHGKVHIWMKRIMPEFYKEKCFKRK